MRNEILIAFWITLLAMVVFGCLQEEPPTSDILENHTESQAETMVETADGAVGEPIAEAEMPEEVSEE